MIEEYGWSIVISVYLVYTLGIGAIIFGVLFVWERVIDRLLTLFRVKTLFIKFVYEYYRKDRPEIKQLPEMIFDGDREEIKDRLAKDKEGSD